MLEIWWSLLDKHTPLTSLCCCKHTSAILVGRGDVLRIMKIR